MKRLNNHLSIEKYGLIRCCTCKLTFLIEDYGSLSSGRCKKCKRIDMSKLRHKRQAAVIKAKEIVGEPVSIKVMSKKQKEYKRKYSQQHYNPEKKAVEWQRYVVKQKSAVIFLENLTKPGDENASEK